MNENYSNLKTLVINLDDNITNYNYQLPYLANLGLNVERFKAINAIKNEHLNPIYKKYISKFASNFQPKSVIGCALTHILSAKHIYDNYLNDYDYFLIMEDDAFPCYNKEMFYSLLNKSLNEIEILDKNWDIIQLHSDAFFPNTETYNTHYLCGSTAAYLISKRGLEKSLDIKVYSYSDFIQHNFLKFNKYRVKSNLFWTDEKYSVNRVMDTKKDFYHLSLSIKSNFIEFINKFILSIPLRGEKTYSHFFRIQNNQITIFPQRIYSK
ncbi:hypothetical protein PGBG_00265 [Phaeocystis globosa virus 14T]|nr:hypothetical protein PGBG_00265 [Phaeocystis globosa virus 14T]